MKSLIKIRSRSIATLLVLSVVCFAYDSAQAFVFASEEEQFEADINEARARAQDFKKYLQRVRDIKKDRESASREASQARAKAEAEREKLRSQYVETRIDYDQEQLERERLEKEWDKEKARQMADLKAVRAAYVRTKSKVLKVMAKEAQIDPADEYDLHWDGVSGRSGMNANESENETEAR